MRRVALGLLALAGVLSIATGTRYITLDQFTAYHAAVSGRPWASLEPGMQTVLLGLLRIVAAGLLASGLALLVLARACQLFGPRRWLLGGALAMLLAQWLPVVYTTLVLKAANPAAQPPVLASMLVLGIGLAGVACAWWAAPPAAAAGAARQAPAGG